MVSEAKASKAPTKTLMNRASTAPAPYSAACYSDQRRSRRQEAEDGRHAQRGAGIYLGLLSLALVMEAIIGLSTLVEGWHQQVKRQLQVNGCVGQVSQKLATTLNQIQFTNQRMWELRFAVIAMQAWPPGIPPLQALLKVVALIQDGILISWKVRQGQWWAQQGCGFSQVTTKRKLKQLASFRPLVSLEFRRDPPDFLGMQPLVWSAATGMPEKFQVVAAHRGRQSAAVITESPCLPRSQGVEAGQAEASVGEGGHRKGELKDSAGAAGGGAVAESEDELKARAARLRAQVQKELAPGGGFFGGGGQKGAWRACWVNPAKVLYGEN